MADILEDSSHLISSTFKPNMMGRGNDKEIRQGHHHTASQLELS